MGLCRALVYVGAAAALARPFWVPVLLGAAALLLYVAGLTLAAKQERLDRVSQSVAASCCSRRRCFVGAARTCRPPGSWSLAAGRSARRVPLRAVAAAPPPAGDVGTRRRPLDRRHRAGRCACRLDRRRHAARWSRASPCFALTLLLQRYRPGNLMTAADDRMENAERMALLRRLAGAAPRRPSSLPGSTIRSGASPAAHSGPALAIAIGLAPRKLGKADLALDADGDRRRHEASPWPRSLRLERRSGRAHPLRAGKLRRRRSALRRAPRHARSSAARSASTSRCFAAFRSIPAPERLVARAARASARPCSRCSRPSLTPILIRTSSFSETQWNQMVVKALFIGSTARAHPGARRAPQRRSRQDADRLCP